jgi:hypothetical protein
VARILGPEVAEVKKRVQGQQRRLFMVEVAIELDEGSWQVGSGDTARIGNQIGHMKVL